MKRLPRTISRVKPRARRTLATQTQISQPAQVSIVGSGPAGFYAAYRLLSRHPDVRVDIFEALPAPFGLARYGVAPDHPEVKNVTHKFEEVAEDERVRFLGNVAVGRDVTPKELASSYDAVIYAYGASDSRSLGVPGEHTTGVLNARDVVAWYNGLPGHDRLGVDLSTVEDVVVVGQGNVALDLARLLLADVDVLRKTDIADHALAELARSRVKRVDIIGRRGPLQASFTIKEVRELMKLDRVGFSGANQGLYEGILGQGELPRPMRRLIDLLAKGNPCVSDRVWSLQYNRSPAAFKGTDRLTAVDLEVNELVEVGSRVVARGTGEIETREAQLALKSVGYQAKPLKGMSEAGLVFDTTRHILPNDRGRVTSLDGFVAGAYCCGWVKNGPVGVIASTMHDAFETADAVAHDLAAGSIPSNTSDRIQARSSLLTRLEEKTQVVDWSAWRRIDAVERSAGESQQRPRRKIVSVREMLEVAGPAH